MINYIKTPQQYELFENFQRIANRELPIHKQKILAPVKPVITRWNSYCSAFERAVELQPAINAYASHHIRHIRDEDTYAISVGNKLLDAAPWMRSSGLSAADWGVITEYLEVLKPLKLATKRLEGRGKGGQYGAIYEVIPVYEYLLGYYEQRVAAYADVNYNAATDAPEDHLAINLRAAWAKASDYYTKLDDSPAYYAATILHPYYKTYCELAWADHSDWLETNDRAFQALWNQYKSAPAAVRLPRVVTNDIDDAIDSLMEPKAGAPAAAVEVDEYQRWKQCEPRAEKGSDDAENPIKYWLNLRDRYPQLSQLALDVLSIPASSCDCERMFSELGDLLEPRRRGISPKLLAAIQCVRRWQKAGFGPQNGSFLAGTDAEIDKLYNICAWDQEDL